MNSQNGARWRNLVGLGSRPRPVVAATPADVLYAENKWRLLRYRSTSRRFATPILLVPSLINRHYVLDLMPGKSFVEFLIGCGHDVLIIDWGTPTAEDRFVTFDDVCGQWLGRAIRKAAALSPRNQTHVLGYCMGGTLAAAHVAVHKEHVASLVALAAPVRFGAPGLLTSWTRAPDFDVTLLTEALGLVPWQLLQSAFQMLRPTLGMAKAVNLYDRAWNDRFLDGFLALETWANDNVSLPGAFFRTWIEAVYREDALLRGNLTLQGQPVDLAAIDCPTLAVVFEQDSIAPAADCAALLEKISSQDRGLEVVQGSHVGGVTSREASKTLWPLLSAWWAARDAAPQRAAEANAAPQQAAAAPAAPHKTRVARSKARA